MTLSEIHNEEIWNSFTNACKEDILLQSWRWGAFQKSFGRQVWRLGVGKDNQIVGGWQIIKMDLPKGFSYLYIPRPVCRSRDKDSVSSLIEQTVELAKDIKSVFIRVDLSHFFDLRSFNFKKVQVEVQPQEELIFDITQKEDDLLKNMKQKTRYNISIAKKSGITVDSFSQNQITQKHVDEWWKLILETSLRNGIRTHPKKYYELMLHMVTIREGGKLYLARYKNKYIAGIFVTHFGIMATYLHGGSSSEHKKFMAPYLLQWTAIQDAKNKGLEKYNLGGASETNKNWIGITRFKKGFSPNTAFIKHGGVWELPVRKALYRVYGALKKIRS